MPGPALSPELYNRIVQWASGRRKDLRSLCLTCKAFQREAEARLYATIIQDDPQRAHMVFRTLISQERLAAHVRIFYFTPEIRRIPITLGPPFWKALQEALIAMHNLENLLITDATFSNTWIFDPDKIKFQLREVKLRFAWDANIIRFLQSQHKLRTIQFHDQMDEPLSMEINTATLRNLRVFDGTLVIGVQFLHCRLAYLQVVIDSEPQPTLLMLRKLSQVHETLRSLSLLDLPEEQITSTLAVIAMACPTIRHLGLLPFPVANVSRHISVSEMC